MLATIYTVASFIVCKLLPVFCAVSWLGCKFSFLPRLWMQFWFGFCFFICVAALWLVTFVVYYVFPLFGVAREKTHRCCAGVLAPIFYVFLMLVPQVRVHCDPKAAELAEQELNSARPVISCFGPHSSFADAYVVVGLMSYSACSRVRPLYKSTLAAIPLWGAWYSRCGAFPVFFKKDTETGNFELDKESQAPVNERMAAFLAAGNAISLFPEGQIGEDPTRIQELRHGAIKMAKQHCNGRLVLLMQHGAWLTWPKNAAMGGLEADVFVDARVVTVPEEMEVAEGAQFVRREMQEMLDALAEKHRALQESRKSK